MDAAAYFTNFLKTGILSKTAAVNADSAAVQTVRSGMDKIGVQREVFKPMLSQNSIARGCRR